MASSMYFTGHINFFITFYFGFLLCFGTNQNLVICIVSCLLLVQALVIKSTTIYSVYKKRDISNNWLFFIMFCFSGEADDRLEVASGMGQDCSCCGCFGQNRKFQSCLQVRKETLVKGFAWHSTDLTSPSDPLYKCAEPNQGYLKCRANIDKNDISAQLCFLDCHWWDSGVWIENGSGYNRSLMFSDTVLVSSAWPYKVSLCVLPAKQHLVFKLTGKLPFSFQKEGEILRAFNGLGNFSWKVPTISMT